MRIRAGWRREGVSPKLQRSETWGRRRLPPSEAQPRRSGPCAEGTASPRFEKREIRHGLKPCRTQGTQSMGSRRFRLSHREITNCMALVTVTGWLVEMTGMDEAVGGRRHQPVGIVDAMHRLAGRQDKGCAAANST